MDRSGVALAPTEPRRGGTGSRRNHVSQRHRFIRTGTSRPLSFAQPPRHGGHDAQPLAQRNTGRSQCRILRPTRERGADRRGIDGDLGRRHRLARHARHLHAGDDRGLAPRHRCGASRRRSYVPPTLALRPLLASRLAPGQVASGGALGDPIDRRHDHGERPAATRDAPRARTPRTAGHRRAISPSDDQCACRWVRRRGGPCRQRAI